MKSGGKGTDTHRRGALDGEGAVGERVMAKHQQCGLLQTDAQVRCFDDHCMLALVVSAHGADLQSGLDAYERGDYEAALIQFRPLAEQGNAEAQLYLGIMYEYGKGVPWNPVQAFNWYRKAAESGHPKA